MSWMKVFALWEELTGKDLHNGDRENQGDDKK
jgi:hypothetical protein